MTSTHRPMHSFTVRPAGHRLASPALALALSFLAATALEAQCPELRVRTWEPGGTETWSKSSDGVKVTTGQEAHIYLHVEGKGSQPYSTSASIGYPQQFGASGREQDVLRHVRMEAQSAEDRRQGRIRFVAQEPGATQLGYQVEAVSAPGRLGDLPRACRRGLFPVEVLTLSAAAAEGGSSTDAQLQPGPDASQEAGVTAAARQLVEKLYTGILRRTEPDRIEESFVDAVVRRGQEGLVEVAQAMTTSPEFRSEALSRTEKAHGGTSTLAELRQRLLSGIYRDLYGYVEPEAREVQEDLSDLDACLSSSARAQESCARLGESLVRHRLFYDHSRNLIESLPTRRAPQQRRR